MDKGRILAVDPGEKRIGIALSDPSRTLASPLTVIRHVSMSEDCHKVATLATENEAGVIVIGQALGGEGEETRQSRHSLKMKETLQGLTSADIVLWDESGTTMDARENAKLKGFRQKQRRGHLDDQAAAFILQSYLECIKASGE